MWDWEKGKQLVVAMIYIGAVYIFLQYLTPVIAPGLIALIFLMITGPFLQKLRRRFHIRRAFGAGVLLLLTFLLFFLIITFLGSHLVGMLPKWIQQAEGLWEYVESMPEKGNITEKLGFDTELMEDILEIMWGNGKKQVLQTMGNGMMSNSVKCAEKLGSILFFLLITAISVVMLADQYDRFMNHILNKSEYYPLLSVMCDVVRYIATWVKAQLVILPLISGLCIGVIYCVGLEHALFIGLLAGVMDVLPFLGTGIVLGPAILVLLVSGEYWKAVILVGLYGGCVILRQTLEPKLIGKRMGIPPLALILSIYGGIYLFGASGILKGPLGYLMVQSMWRGRRNA